VLHYFGIPLHATSCLGLSGVSLAILTFTKVKPQLSQREVETSRKLSNVCGKGHWTNEALILQNLFPT